jgi:D-serine deaminase-like pyridoxal phosphate-dependent protein
VVELLISKDVLKQLSLPALLLDLDAFDDNCKKIAEKANGKKIRIATKSIRSVEVINRVMQSSPVYQGLMCFSPTEVIFLEEQGFNDLLLGYPCTDNEALYKISNKNKHSKSITIMIDCIEQTKLLEEIAKKTDGIFYICIDIDMSTTFAALHFGVRRSPISTPNEVVKLARFIKQSNHLVLVGIMGYEAQIAGVGDRVPSQLIKNKIVSYMKKMSIKEIKRRRKTIVDALVNEGIQLDFVNGGGTGSLHITCYEDVITEVTVGSGLYAPLLFDYYTDFTYNPALFFALPIVRKPTSTIYTCLGGGYIASGSAGKDRLPQPVYPPGGRLLPIEGAGEVQTPVYYENESLEIGDAILFRAAKSGEICERFEEMICLSNNQIVDRYPTYRGDGVCFL